jgi:uncharacterized Zn finger protein (UPF0148 family)
MNIHCPACGAPLLQGARFCPTCALPLTAIAKPTPPGALNELKCKGA